MNFIHLREQIEKYSIWKASASKGLRLWGRRQIRGSQKGALEGESWGKKKKEGNVTEQIHKNK